MSDNQYFVKRTQPGVAFSVHEITTFESPRKEDAKFVFCDDKNNVFTLCELPNRGLTLSKWNLNELNIICLEHIEKCIWSTEEQKHIVKFKNKAGEYFQLTFENLYQYLYALSEINATFNSHNYQTRLK